MEATRNSLMKKIQMYEFVLVEITLYLDTHKTCMYALDYYKKYRDLHAAAIKEYAEKFGPLNVTQAKADGSWDWTDGPWPWEKEAN